MVGNRVYVTGYPDSENVPITCVNWTSRFSDTLEGGDTPSLSYSVRFGPAILALYRQAVTAETAAHPAGTAS